MKPFHVMGDVFTGNFDNIEKDFKGEESKPEPKLDYHRTVTAINKIGGNQKKVFDIVHSLNENQKDIIQGERDITSRQKNIIQNQRSFGKTQKKIISAEKVLNREQKKLFDTDKKIIKNQSNIVNDIQDIQSNQLDLEVQTSHLEAKNRQEDTLIKKEERQINKIKNDIDNLQEKVVETYYRDLDFKEMTTLLEMLDNKNEIKEFLARHRTDYEKLTADQKKLVKQIARRF